MNDCYAKEKHFDFFFFLSRERRAFISLQHVYVFSMRSRPPLTILSSFFIFLFSKKPKTINPFVHV